jgi:amino acid transporter
MSEEVQDASFAVPHAMITSFVINGLMGLIILITFLFCIPNVSDAVNDSTGYPFLYVLRSSMSNGAVIGITMVLLLLILAASIDSVASASRQTFAFARDHGLPFSRWISNVSSYS